MFVGKNNELLEIHGPQSSNFATNGKSNYYYDKDVQPVIINCSRTAKPTLVSFLLYLDMPTLLDVPIITDLSEFMTVQED